MIVDYMEKERFNLTDYFGVNLAQLLSEKISGIDKDFPTNKFIDLVRQNYSDKTLTQTAERRKLPLKVIKLESPEQAQSAPTPATIFSLFHNGKFVTTDVSACMDSRFDKIVNAK